MLDYDCKAGLRYIARCCCGYGYWLVVARIRKRLRFSVIALVTMALIGVMLVTGTGYAQQRDYTGEIKESISDWLKEQTTDAIKSIFKTRENKKEEEMRLSFGALIFQCSSLLLYAILISYMMPHKISSLLQITAYLGCLQFIAIWIYQWIS